MKAQYKAYKKQTNSVARNVQRNHVTVEQTSKAIKKKLICTHILAVVGLILVINAANDPAPSVMKMVGSWSWLIGTFWYFWLKVEIWWNHG